MESNNRNSNRPSTAHGGSNVKKATFGGFSELYFLDKRCALFLLVQFWYDYFSHTIKILGKCIGRNNTGKCPFNHESVKADVKKGITCDLNGNRKQKITHVFSLQKVKYESFIHNNHP
jgi:hypothetical protein